MTTGWETTTLGDCGTWVSGGTPSTSTASYWGGDLPWMSSKSLIEFRVRDSERRLTALGAENAKLVPRDTILMVVRGMSLKSEFRMGITQREVALSQDLKGLLPKPGLDPAFLAYAIQSRSDEILDMVDEAGHGTGRLQTDRLYALKLLVPPLDEQRAIAATLGALDDKVESNHRGVDYLHDLVQMHFERAVQEEGTEFTALGDVTTVVRGRSYKSAELRESDTALVTLKSIDRGGGYKPDGLKPYLGAYKPEQVVVTGDLVVAQTDLTQGAEVVGRGVRVPPVGDYKTLVASLDLAIVRPKGSMSAEYLYGLLTSESFRQHCRSHVTGTTVLHLAKDAMPTWRAPIAPLRGQEAFAEVAQVLLARMDSLNQESKFLARLRDAILPELLSGRLRVPVKELVAV